MVVVRIFLLFFMVLLAAGPAICQEDNRSRFFTHNQLSHGFFTNITLEGSLLHIAKFKFWLKEIAKVPHGKETLEAILQSGHNLTLVHSRIARISAGRTQAPMSENLINGKGESVVILFDASVSDRGSHMVYNNKKELIEYTAVENLFHELAHARHKMRGTWRYFDSEQQAIEEENIFRRELALIKGVPVTERAWLTGVPIESVAGFKKEPPKNYHIRSNPPLPAGFDVSSHERIFLKAVH